MNDNLITTPSKYKDLVTESEKIAFSMPSDLQTGSILRTLVASKPGGTFLDLGTGTGLSLAWIIDGMDQNSKVTSIDINPDFQAIARKYFSEDARVEIICVDGDRWIEEHQHHKYDLIFADAWPGKYSSIDLALDMLKTGGIYLIDDMLPQPNWPEGHQANVNKLVEYLESRSDLQLTKLNWSTGLVIVTKAI